MLTLHMLYTTEACQHVAARWLLVSGGSTFAAGQSGWRGSERTGSTTGGGGGKLRARVHTSPPTGSHQMSGEDRMGRSEM